MRVLLLAFLLAGTAAQAATLQLIPPTEYDREGNPPIPAGVAFQYKLYGGKCGQELKLLSTFTSPVFQRTPVGLGAHCYHLTAAILSEVTGEPGEESELGEEFRITVVAVPVAQKTKPPGVSCTADCENVTQ